MKTVISRTNTVSFALVLCFLLIFTAFINLGAFSPDETREVIGIDEDSDGLRDDIQKYIEELFPNSRNKKNALRQYAKSSTDFIKYSNNEQATIDSAKRLSEAGECVEFVFENNTYAILTDLEAKIFNTELRVKALMIAQKHLGGKMFTSNKIENWQYSCKFELNLKD